MKIGIVPKISEPYKNQFEFTVDLKLINFLKQVFKKSEIVTLNQFNKKEKINLLILQGGNDLVYFNKKIKNIIREKYNNYYFNFAQKKRIPTLGICLGAQFIAKKYNSILIKKHHVGDHAITFSETAILKNTKLPKTTNSYHNYVIKKLGKRFIKFAIAKDKSIEAFISSNKKILGIMWHPERFKKIRNFDKKIVKNFYDISNTSSRSRK